MFSASRLICPTLRVSQTLLPRLAPPVARMSVLNRGADNEITGPQQHLKIAVVLSGCGVYDGSEIYEAAALMFHLTRQDVYPVMYAPDSPQMHVVDHIKGEPMEGETRNCLVEAGRIARGKVDALKNLKPAYADGVIFVGGFGAAKNLSDFAVKGKDMTLHPEVERVIKSFHSAHKVLGFMCISPVLAARAIPGVKVTLGRKDPGDGCWPYSDAIGAVQDMGAEHQEEDVFGVCVDVDHRVISTPAFMYNTRGFYHIYDGVGNFVRNYVAFIQRLRAL